MSEGKILEHLKEYLQMLIDSNTHKIFYNDLMYDEKTIDCINAIDTTLKELERLHSIIKEVREYIDRRDLDWGSEEHEYVLEILDKGE